MTKAAKQPHVVGETQVGVYEGKDTFEVGPDPGLPQGDYRQLVHELDEAEYRDIRLMVMEIRNAYVRRRGWGGGGQRQLSQATHPRTLQTGG